MNFARLQRQKSDSMQLHLAVAACVLLGGANVALVPQARKVTEVRATFGIVGK